MKKILFILTCLAANSAFANCEVYIDNYVNFNKIESGSLTYDKFDILYNRYTHESIPLRYINDSYYAIGTNGDDFDCNTLNYRGQSPLTIQLQPYCKNKINSQTITKINKGSHLTMNCESDISLNINKQYNNLINLAIVPTGFDDITLRNYVVPKNESSGIAFTFNNLTAFKSAMSCSQSGKYFDCQKYFQLKLLLAHKINEAQIEVFSFDHEKHTKIGECNVTHKNNQPLMKCSTLPQYAKLYDIVVTDNFITVIDPNQGKELFTN